MHIYDFKTVNAAVHLLFLVESLVLKNAAVIVNPNVKPRKIHLFVEEFRPLGCKDALEAASLLQFNQEKFEETLKQIIEKSAGKVVPNSLIKNIMSQEDIKHISQLLFILVDSGSHINWGEQKEIL